MEKFCKVINLPQTQCLVMLDYDTDDEMYFVRAIMETSGMRVSLGWGYQEHAIAIKNFRKFNKNDAANAYKLVNNFPDKAIGTVVTVNKKSKTNKTKP